MADILATNEMIARYVSHSYIRRLRGRVDEENIGEEIYTRAGKGGRIINSEGSRLYIRKKKEQMEYGIFSCRANSVK